MSTHTPFCLTLAAALIFTASLPSAASAQGEPPAAQAQGGRPAGPPANSLTIGIGAGVSNRYIGSEDFAPQPFPSIEYRFDGGRAIRTSQFGFEVDVTRSRAMDFGPIVRINTGRNDFQSANDPAIEALGIVSATVELGGFVAMSAPLSFSDQGPPDLLVSARASIVQATGGHDGMLIDASIGLVKPGRKWTFVTSVSATYASGSVQDAFFSINAAGSAASGLNVFDANAGMRDVGLTGVVSYRFAPKWSVTSVINYARLIGDAANSPIVAERGSPNQALFGLNVAYTFF